MSQTTYANEAPVAFRGLLGDSGHDMFLISRAVDEAAGVPAGVMLVNGTDPDTQASLPSAAGETPQGVVAHQQAREDYSLAGDLMLADGETASLVRKGRVWVRVEGAVANGGDVYFRHTTGSGTELGAFRADADGDAEISTLTPNPVANDTMYTVDIHIGDEDYHFEYMSDATATATEICDGIRAAMALDATFTALVVASGTTTLVLTAQTAGQELDVVSSGPGLFDIVESTPPAPTCDLLPGAKFASTAAAAGVALLEINIP